MYYILNYNDIWCDIICICKIFGINIYVTNNKFFRIFFIKLIHLSHTQNFYFLLFACRIVDIICVQKFFIILEKANFH